jgi:hypothetical protein
MMNFNFDKLSFEDGIYKISKRVDFFGVFVKRQYIETVFEYAF